MDYLLAAESVPTLVLALVFGAVIGSFLNVVITRLPIQLQRQWQRECAEMNGTPVTEQDRFSIAVPGSHCPQCKTSIAWYDNIPLLSYLVLRARCRHCKTRISVAYWLVELISCLAFGLIAWHYGFSLTALVLATSLSLLICLFVIDWRHQLLPDQLTYPLLWIALLWSMSNNSAITPDSAIIGAVVGYLSLWSVYWAYKLITGKEGMGYGDFKLLAAITAFTGATLLPVTILASSVCGAIIGLFMLRQKSRSQPIPFGPFLIGGGLLSYFYGTELLFGYWRWLGGF
ncbi:A24 family peptidase [Idiomarina sp. HP20-50]|uniref:prepilin peptidase n=1 Tax=Idiomarina sp. HP20-50 TaxID=3070813 RepID=UPI00294AEE1A|nr:A24 family peptidase [Idiomarina sp. HP20-50]MDV6316022.1 A24 family peptidase [Idiomarina sp. HP20-50]